MYEFLLVIFFLVSIILITLIMLQQNRGANSRISFSTHTSSVLFSSKNHDSFMVRIIVIMAALFFIISLMLSNINSSKISERRKIEWKNLNTLTKFNKINSDYNKSTQIR